MEVSEEDLKLLEAGKHKQLLKDMEEEEVCNGYYIPSPSYSEASNCHKLATQE